MAKAKRKRKRKKRRASRAGVPKLLWIALALAVVGALAWLGSAGFEDRHWHAFIDAGNRAYGRGNYAYAERMYSEALQQARDLDSGGELERKSLKYLDRVRSAQSRQEQARLARQQARGAGR